MTLTGNSTIDATILTAEGVRQAACNVAGASQATQAAAYATYYRGVMAAKLAASPALDISNEIFALQDQLGVTV